MANIAQNGLAHSENLFDRERYESIRAIAAEIMDGHSNASSAQVNDLLAGESGHATPNVDVRGLVLNEDKVLLVREGDDRLWSLPGRGVGRSRRGSSEAVAREVLEELGIRVEVVKLLAVHDRKHDGLTPYPFSVYMLFFLCRLVDDLGVNNPETIEVAFFSRSQLPDLSTYRVTQEQLQDIFSICDDHTLPVEFD